MTRKEIIYDGWLDENATVPPEAIQSNWGGP